MKLLSIVNSNAGDGFKLVTVGFPVNGQLVESDWFIHPDGRVEPQKNTKDDLVDQIKHQVAKSIGKFNLVQMERDIEIARLEKRLAELKEM